MSFINCRKEGITSCTFKLLIRGRVIFLRIKQLIYVSLALLVLSCSVDPISMPESSQPKAPSDNSSDDIKSLSSFTDLEKAQAYSQHVQSVVATHCGQCHGVEQSPKFAVDDTFEALKEAEVYINFASLEESKLYLRPEVEKHNECGECDVAATNILDALKNFKSELLSK